MASARTTDVEPKTPGETKLYTKDWSGELTAGTTILTSTWAVQSGLTKASDDSDDTTATILVSGGVSDADYACVNTVTTSNLETLQFTGIVPVRER